MGAVLRKLSIEKLKKKKNLNFFKIFEIFLELVSKELNHLAAILPVYARGLIFMK